MKTILLTIVSVLSFTAFSQQKIVYMSEKAVNEYSDDIFNQVLNQKNTSSLITILKKEFMRNDLNAFDGENSIQFESINDFYNSRTKNSDEFFHFVGLRNVETIDTTEQFIQASNCYIEYYSIKNSLGEDSISYDANTGEEIIVSGIETICDYFYSFDDLSGVILIDGIDGENPEEIAKFGTEQESFYTQNRIGFVKVMDLDTDWNSSNGFEESKRFVTFSTTIGELEQLTGINLEKTYKKLRKYALKAGVESELSVFDISEINELANMFNYQSIFNEKDLHFGITLFN
jgi:hypothetical protein